MAGKKAFGEQNPTQGEDPVSWQTWSDGAAGVPTITGDADWGKLHLPLTGAEGRSAVYDHGSTATRTYTLTENRYGTGASTALLQYRTDTTAFAQDDATPAWTTYTVPFSVSARYVQIRATTDDAVYYYVSNDGDDGADGLTPATAWETLNKVNTSTFNAGDQILLNKGDTWNERLVPPSSGSSSGYITFGSYGTGNAPIIDGTGITIADGGLVEINNKDYIKLVGLNVIDSDDFGIYAINSAYIDIQYCTTNSTHASGIGVWNGDQVWINHNTVVNARCVTLANGGHEESISLATVTNFEVGWNDISMDGVEGYLGNEGIDCKASCVHGIVHDNYIHGYDPEGGAIYVDGWTGTTEDIDIYRNRCWGNPNGIVMGGEAGGTVNDVNIYNNLVYNVYDTGIGFNVTGSNGPRTNINVYHNTIHGSQYNGGAAIYVRTANVQNILIVNNITSFDGTNGQIVIDADAAAEVEAHHNLSYGSTWVDTGMVELSTNPDGYNGHDNLTADPLFVSTVTPDLNILSTSPAINAGYAYGLTTDYSGASRPKGGAVDIGAYESASYYATRILSLFGEDIIAYLKLDEASGTFADASGNGCTAVSGGATGPTRSVESMDGENTAISFPGSAAYVNWYTTALRDLFDGAEGTLIVWGKTANAGVWSDGTYRVLANLYTDSNNYVTIARSNSYNNMLLFEHKAGGTSRNHYGATNARTTFFMAGITWSVAAGNMFPYINGGKVFGTMNAPGTWSGALNANAVMLGALTTAAGSVWSGSAAHAILLNRPATPVEMLAAYRYLDGTKTITILGDSISAPVYNQLRWADIVREGYNGGLVAVTNYAVSGQSILSHMDAQVTAAANDNADIIIIHMGTNDVTTTGLQAEVEENIIELKADHPNATIYFMNILPRWTDESGDTPVDKSAFRTAIAAACTAQSITCWDTYDTPWITAADTADGLHPNAAGIAKVAAAILARLA